MLCKIADLLVEIPTAGGMDIRCRDYLTYANKDADIVIKEDGLVISEKKLSYESATYIQSGWLFYSSLLLHDGLMLHSSAVELDGKAYLFSGPCGMGKSTHTRLWQEAFPNARVFNDDKPALRRLDGKWYAYGTPWCGKDGININLKAPIAGICFLQRGKQNEIRRLSPIEATAGIISQTLNTFKTERGLDVMIGIVEKLATEIPVFELRSLPTTDAARLSYEAMSREAKEI